ncbi:hypothetical protein BDV12DRAFT_200810 [Aspergillus spectabilis]
MNSDSKSTVTASKALLIGSPTNGLKGPLNDVENIANLLRRYGFSTRECCGAQATRDGIIEAWNQLISEVQTDDTVLIYYSGHGGVVKAPRNQLPKKHYQFIVPTDYESPSTASHFQGILDIELSQLVHKTTERTHNVTVIFDCCFSGRMTRDPTHGAHAVRKALEHIPYDKVAEMYERIVQGTQKRYPSLTSVEGNQHAVRIVAAADSETAFEYDEGDGRVVGAFTKALIANLESALKAKTTWKHMILRVSEFVSTQFPTQHPHVEGPQNRVVFSQEVKDTDVYPVHFSGSGDAVLQAGQVAGVRVGNTFKVLCHTTAEGSESTMISQGIVTGVSAFEAYLKLQPIIQEQQRALAYPETQMPYCYPVSVTKNLRQCANNQIRNMRFIQLTEENTTSMPFAHLDQQEAVSQALSLADSISRAGHLLSLKPASEEQLDHDLEVGFSTVETDDRDARELPTDGTAHVDCLDRICISLGNKNDESIYVSVFNVTAAGRISLMSKSSPRGIRVRPGDTYVMGKVQHTGAKMGMGMTWPKRISKDVQGPVPEWFVCLITNKKIDLRCLERDPNTTQPPPVPRGDPSQLEKVAYQISYGQGRCCSGEEDSGLKWDLVSVLFSLSPVWV